MRNIPLNALRALVAVFETGGIRSAARLLVVSPSSIQRHLRELEGRIGIALTQADGRAIKMTVAGERLARRAQEAMMTLMAGLDDVTETRGSNALLIATTESFADHWLIPRLSKFSERYPRIQISIQTGRELSTIPNDANLAIRMGAGPWTNQICDPLMSDRMVVVAAPSLLEPPGKTRTIDSLLERPLLHDRDPQVTWRLWGASQGLSSERFSSGMRLSSTASLLTAAISGLGLAVVRERLARDALSSGQLVCPSEAPAVDLGPSYWLIRSAQPRSYESRFIEWLKAEAEAER